MANNGKVMAARNAATDLVNFKVLLNGTAISGEYGIVSLNVSKSYNKISMAKLVITDGDPALQDFTISSKDNALTPGNEIEIKLGYHTSSATVFKGIIIKHALSSGRNRGSFLTIEAKDKAIKLSLERKNKCYTDQSDPDIIRSIAGGVGLEASVDTPNPSVQHKEMVQYNVTDWDFLVSRAEVNGLLVLTDDNKLVVSKPGISKAATREIMFGMDVIEFDTEIDAASQIQKVTSHSWNYKDQKVEQSESSSSYKENGNLSPAKLSQAVGQANYGLAHMGDLSVDELKLWSDSVLLKRHMARSAGRIKVVGTTEIRIGDVVTLKGFGERFNGNVLVTGIRHSLGASIWETDIQFGLPPQLFSQRDDIIERPASGLVPGVNGLQIGVVTKLQDDPDNQDRISIKLPLVDDTTTLWARVSTLDAGNERGSFFRPEINDEVLVGFLNDDPRYPVVLGMLHSGKNPAPLKAEDPNHEKGFVTRSKMKMIFNDEKKSLTIETPKGKKVEINEDGDAISFSDDHNNKITMNKDGITIESLKDIIIKTSAGDVKTSGVNIESKATAQFTAEANASATLKCSGPTVVKGAIVNIN